MERQEGSGSSRADKQKTQAARNKEKRKNSYRYLEVGKQTKGNGKAETRRDAKTGSWKSKKRRSKQRKGKQNYDYLKAEKLENEGKRRGRRKPS